MRSKVAQGILDKTPLETKIFMDYYAAIVMRVNQLLKEKGFTQKTLAEKLGKSPSEISKWLNGSHNFTLQSLAKLESELGAPLMNVPHQKTFKGNSGGHQKMTVYKNDYKPGNTTFRTAKAASSKSAVKKDERATKQIA